MTKVKNLDHILWLKIEDCEAIYNSYSQKSKTAGIEPLPEFSKRYEGRLESILESTKMKASLMGKTVPEIAAGYFTHLVKSQAHFNGNKRMGVLYTLVFLLINNHKLTMKTSDLSTLALLAVKEDAISFDEIEQEVAKVFTKNITLI